MKIIKRLTIVSLIFINFGCGIKSDPLPPAEQQPIQKAVEIKTLPPDGEIPKKEIKKK